MFVASRYRPAIADRTITTTSVSANGVEFGLLQAGSGPLALCLHGFPDSAHTWRRLLPQLADAGYHAVAPFMRGYAPTQVPTDGRYQIAALGLDAVGLHEVLGGDSDAVIIGHDWGASAAWSAAGIAPQRWSKVVGLAVPPGPAFAVSLLSNITQVKRSWYMFFLLHGLSDLVVPANDFAFIDRLWADWSPGYPAGVDLAHVKAALSESANLAAALGYYRAALGDGYQDPELADMQAAASNYPTQPTLYLHGVNDGCIGAEVAEAARAMAPENVTVSLVGGTGHYLHLEQSEAINARILDFLSLN